MTDRDLRALAARSFRSQFAERSVECIAVAPGRVNLIGGHVDYNQGLVLPLAIERQTLLAGSKGRANQGRVFSQLTGQTWKIDLSQPLQRSRHNWENYLLGVINELQKLGCELTGFDAVIQSDLEPGAGLGSSAALEVAFAKFIIALNHLSVSDLELVQICQRAEHSFAGVPCGIMDQYSSVFGQKQHLIALDCETICHELIAWPSPQTVLLIINSNAPHQLVDGEYALRRQQCQSALGKLGLDSFRNADSELLEREGHRLDQTELRRATHVINEIERCTESIKAIQAGDLNAIGQYLYESHDSLRDLFEVSCSELDCLVDIGREIGAGGGVWGMRMTGGGFGGCVVAIVDKDHVQNIARELSARYQSRCGRTASWFVTRPAPGARVITAHES